MATLADILRQTGYAQNGTLSAPASNSPMTTALSEHIKGLPQQFEQNQQNQMNLLSQAYPGNTYESMMTQGDLKALAELAMQVPLTGIVSPKVVNQFGMATTLPKDDIFSQAVANTPMARISDEGLHLNLMRKQKPEQAMTESVRSGVYYLPEGSPSMKHYGGSGGYGGTDKITGETLYKNPLFVKGATGGKAPEAAYVQLTDKNQLKTLQDDVSKVISTYPDEFKTLIDGKTIESPVAQRIVKLGGKPEAFIENMQSKLNSQKEVLKKASKKEVLDGFSE